MSKAALIFVVLVAVATATSCSKYKVTASSLRLRTSPSTQAQVKSSYPKGTTVCVVNIANGWAKLNNGYYVSSGYLSKVPYTSASTTSNCTKYTVTASKLNVRSGPGQEYGVIKTYKKGASLCVISINAGWAKLNDYTSYVSTSYISKNGQSSSSSSSNNSSSTNTSTSTGRKDTSPRPAKVTSKSPNVVYYAQCDSRWKTKMYSTHSASQTYCNSACGPTSMAMVIATLVDPSVTPVTLGEYALKNNFRTYNSGTSWGFYASVAKKYGLKCTQTSKTDDAVTALKNGKLVVASMGKGYWTSAGHYICLYDVSGNYIVAHDPAKTTRVKNTISSFKKESKQYFIISK